MAPIGLSNYYEKGTQYKLPQAPSMGRNTDITPSSNDMSTSIGVEVTFCILPFMDATVPDCA